MSDAIVIAWFLWATVHGNPYHESERNWQQVKQFKNQATCEKALKKYQVEMEKAYPESVMPKDVTQWTPLVIVDLKCSPLYPQ